MACITAGATVVISDIGPKSPAPRCALLKCPEVFNMIVAGPISLRDALLWHADLLSPLSKQALQSFAPFVSGEEGKRLRHLLSPEGHEDYKNWQSQSRCLLEVLEEFPQAKVPLGEGLTFGRSEE